MEDAVLITAAGLGLALLPVLALVGLLGLANRIQRERAEAVARQIRLTDAIHREFGAVAAPVVEKRRGRRWRAVIAVPFARPEVVATVVTLAERTLGEPERGRAGVEILLTPQPAMAAPPARRGGPAPQRAHLVEERAGGHLGHAHQERHVLAALASGEASLR
jgi:hypothetical protein